MAIMQGQEQKEKVSRKFLYKRPLGLVHGQGENNSSLEKDYEAAYEKRRLTNLYEAVLNTEPVLIHDFKGIGELFRYYNLVLDRKFGTSDEFKTSMQRCQECFEDSRKLNRAMDALKVDAPDSFLILPIFEMIHTSSAVIKKQKDGTKFYIVDKFLANGLSLLPDRAYCKEYSVKDGMEKLLVRDLQQAFFMRDYTKIFKTLDKYSDKRVNLKITSRNQKLANCCYKEPEAAIKFAFATRNLSTESIRKLRTNNDFSNSFKIKWGPNRGETSHIHRMLGKIMQELNPNVPLEKLDKIYQNYDQNKTFRKLFKSGVSMKASLEKAFDPTGCLQNQSPQETMKALLSNVNWDTAKQISKLVEVVSKVYGPKNGDEFKSCVFDITLLGEAKNIMLDKSFEKLADKFAKIEKDFPVLGKCAMQTYANAYLVVAYSFFDRALEKAGECAKNMPIQAIDSVIQKLSKATTLYSEAHGGHYFEGIIHLTKGFSLAEEKPKEAQIEWEKARDSFDKTLELHPHFAEANYGRALAFEKLGEHQKSRDSFQKALNEGAFINDKRNKDKFYKERTIFHCLPNEMQEGLRQMHQFHKLLKMKQQNKTMEVSR